MAGRGGFGRGLCASLAMLASPPSLVAIATLLVNDHVLKWLAPSFLTGKLSDFAGLYFAPAIVLVGVFAITFGWLERKPTAVARTVYLVVAAIFGALKLTDATATPLTTFAAGVGYPVVIAVDPTDLIALCVLPLSYAAWSRRFGRGAAVGAGWTRRLATLSVAAASIVATSSPPGPSVTSFSADTRADIIYATVEYTSSADGVYLLDVDDGSWRRASPLRGELIADPRGTGSVFVLQDDSWAPTLQRLGSDGRVTRVGLPDPGPRPKVVNVYAPTLVAIAPWDPDVLFFGRNGNLFRSTDGGASWTDIGAPGLVQDIALSSEANLIYVLTNRSLYRSKDGGERWTFMATVTSTSFYDPGGIAVHPRDPGLVIIGSRDELLRTTDGGTVLTAVYTKPGPYADSTTWLVRFDPSDDDHIYALPGRGCCSLLESRDRGMTWASAGIDATEVAIDGHGNVYVVSGARNRVLRRVGDEWVDVTYSLPVQRSR